MEDQSVTTEFVMGDPATSMSNPVTMARSSVATMFIQLPVAYRTLKGLRTLVSTVPFRCINGQIEHALLLLF